MVESAFGSEPYFSPYEQYLLSRLIPANLHLELGRHIGRQETVVWPDPDITAPEYIKGSVTHMAVGHALGFVSLRAHELQHEADIHGIPLSVLSEEVAMHGLRSYYAQLRKAKDTEAKVRLLDAQKQILRTLGRAYAESYVIKELHTDIKNNPIIPPLKRHQRQFLLARGILDMVGALGTALQPSKATARTSDGT